MRQIFLLLVAALTTQLLLAQTSGQHEVIGSAGEELKTSNGTLSFTVGEVVTNTHVDTSSSLGLTQGFQQTYFEITDISEMALEKFKVKVWPNPTMRYLNIDLGIESENESIQGEILDVSGVKIEEFKPHEKPVLDLESYPVSNYILKIYDAKSMRVRMFKIIKM